MMYANVLKVFAVAIATVASACGNAGCQHHDEHDALSANPHDHTGHGEKHHDTTMFTEDATTHPEEKSSHPEEEEQFEPVTDEQWEKAKSTLSLEEEDITKISALVELFPDEFKAASVEEMTRGICYNYVEHPQEGQPTSKEDLLEQLTELVHVQIPQWQEQMKTMEDGGDQNMMDGLSSEELSAVVDEATTEGVEGVSTEKVETEKVEEEAAATAEL